LILDDCVPSQEILKDDKGPEPLNIDFGSEISSQSEFMSTNKNPYRYKTALCHWLDFVGVMGGCNFEILNFFLFF
jgi:hypothetical protein